MTRFFIARALTTALLAFATTGGAGLAAEKAKDAPAAAKSAFADALFEGLAWRSIGPFRGGRVTAVAGVPGQPLVYYMGATGGGVWKTTNGGIDWAPITDGQVKTGSVGAIAVAPSDPNVLYVGMGESCIRGNVSHGDGVYRSTDAGKTWTHVGLRDTRQVGRIRVHPQDPDLVYVAALGHTLGPHAERGVFRSSDGGKSWSKVALRRRQDRRRRSRHGPREPARPLRGRLAGAADAVEPGERRARERPLQDDRRRRHVEEARRQGAAEGALGPDRRERLPGPIGAPLRGDRGRGRRGLPLGRRGGDVGADERGPQAPAARLVLHPRRRRPEGARHRLRPQRAVLPVEGRRQDLRDDPASRTATTTTCGSPRRTRAGWSRATTAGPRSRSTAA